MNERTELICSVWLSENLGAACACTERLMSEYGSCAAVFDNRSELAAKYPELARENNGFTLINLDSAEKMISDFEKNPPVAGVPCGVINRLSPQFPQRLSEIPRPPLVLWYAGDLSLLSDTAPLVAEIGTRYISRHGRQASYEFAHCMAQSGITVISGMAAGADSAAHLGALSAGGKTIAVTGCGLYHTFPPMNKSLKRDIMLHGLAVSEYAPDIPSEPHRFPQRNRIVSGLSHAVLVTEARAGSGSLITANCAAEQGRDVFALMTDYDRKGAEQIGGLIVDGAIPVSSPGDICLFFSSGFKGLKKYDAEKAHSDFLARFGEKVPKMEGKPVTERQFSEKALLPLPDTISETALKIYKILDTQTPVHVDEIVRASGSDSREVLSALTELELENVAVCLPGRHYIKQ